MNIADLKNIDPASPGAWPTPIKALAILVLCAAVLGLGFYFDTQHQIVALEKVQGEETSLKEAFENKQKKAANLEPLKLQLQEMKQSFGAMLRLLPNKTEIEGLLVDISQSGLAAGLEFELFKPGKEKPEEFYAVQPIEIRVTGNYHEFGEFISSVAALPRIVTQHDIAIQPRGGKAKKEAEAAGSSGGRQRSANLVMSMTAKTYRYLEEDEIKAAAAAAEEGKGKKKRRKKKK